MFRDNNMEVKTFVFGTKRINITTSKKSLVMIDSIANINKLATIALEIHHRA